MEMGSAALRFSMEFEKQVSLAMVVAAANPVESDSIAKEVGYLCAAAFRQRRDRYCRHPAAKQDSSARRIVVQARQSQGHSI